MAVNATKLSSPQTEAERILELEWELSKATAEINSLESEVGDIENERDELSKQLDATVSAKDAADLENANDAMRDAFEPALALLAVVAYGKPDDALRAEAAAFLARVNVFGARALQTEAAAPELYQ